MQHFFETHHGISKIKKRTKIFTIIVLSMPVLVILLSMLNSNLFLIKIIVALLVGGFFMIFSFPIIWFSTLMFYKYRRYRFFNNYLDFIAYILNDKDDINQEIEYLNLYFTNTFGENIAFDAIAYLKVSHFEKKDIFLKPFFYDKLDGLQLITRLILISVCDNNFDDLERTKIYEIGKYLNFSKKIIDKIISKYVIIEEPEQNNFYESKNQIHSFKRNISYAYDILGISENSNFEQVKTAYRNLVKKHHPDKFAYLGEEAMQKANEMFRKIQQAYETIENKQKNT